MQIERFCNLECDLCMEAVLAVSVMWHCRPVQQQVQSWKCQLEIRLQCHRRPLRSTALHSVQHSLSTAAARATDQNLFNKLLYKY